MRVSRTSCVVLIGALLLTVLPLTAASAAPSAPGPATLAAAATSPVVGAAVTSAGSYVAHADGSIDTSAGAPNYGSLAGTPLNKPIVDIAATPSGRGYWLVATDGGMFSFGDAAFFGSTGAITLNKPIVGMASTPTGRGYWLVASDGGIFSFGDAAFFGSTGAITLNKPIVGMASTPTGTGYWLVASDGGIFAFGDATFQGSTGAMRLNQPIVGMASTPTGLGYWLVAADGGVFAFGDAGFLGSSVNAGGRSGVVRLARLPGGGYATIADDGTLAQFGTDGGTSTPPPTTPPPPTNTAPTVGVVADQTTPEDTTEGPVPFTVGDAETAATGLTVTATAANPTLVPTVTVTGSGADRAVTLVPAANASGSTLVTVTVSDGELVATETFTQIVTSVNDAPTIGDVANRSTANGQSTGTIAVTVGDVETGAGSLSLVGTSSNTSLVPNGNIVEGGSGANRTVTVTPAAGQSGTATITLTVGDGTTTASDTFTLTVSAAANSAPTVSALSDRSNPEDTAEGPISFTVGDAQSGGALSVTATSSNTTLVPNAGITFGGSGANRTVTVTPAANQSGTATITVTVSDGSLSASESFVQTFTAVNDAPTIADVANRTTTSGTATGAISVAVGDVETSAGSLTMSGSSSNTTLVPNAGITFGGSGANRTVTVTPAGGQTGTATITVTVSDGSLTTSDTFTLTVTAGPNTAPNVADVADQTASEDTFEGPIGFSVSDAETPASSLVVTATSSNTTRVPNTGLTLGGSGGSRTLTINPAPDQSGTTTITLTVSDGGLTDTDTFVQTFVAVNDAPTIGDVSNRTTTAGVAVGPITFSVGDLETSAGSLSLSASSSNTTLVPNANVDFGGSGANRTVTVTPVGGQTGSTLVTITASDGALTASDTFSVTVTASADTAPTIAAISDQATSEDTVEGPLAVTVGDAETAAGSLTVSATSSNTGVVPNSGLVLGGSGANRTLTLTPAANQGGSSTITVTVGDGTTTTSETFVQTVTAVNDTPTIGAVSDRSTTEGNPVGPISFTVGDVETSAGSLTVSGSSSNTTLVPNANVDLGGSGSSRTVTVTPADGQTGSATITLTVGDGTASATETFVLTVTAGGEAPTGVFVATNGTGSGTLTNPASLTAALNGSVSVAAGQTVWLRGGTYTGRFTTNLNGTSSARITVRSYPGETAVINSPQSQNGDVLIVAGSYTDIRDLEVMMSDTSRYPWRDAGITVQGHHNRIINNYIHDTGCGITSFSSATDIEIYGNIILNVGSANSGESCHSIYAANSTGTKTIEDNIWWGSGWYGLHLYTEGGSLRGFQVRGNVGAGPNLIGGLAPIDQIVVEDNDFEHLQLGYGADQNGTVTVRNNRLGWGPDGRALSLFDLYDQLTVTGNTFYGHTSDGVRFQNDGGVIPTTNATWNGNTYHRLAFAYPTSPGEWPCCGQTFSTWRTQHPGWDTTSTWTSNAPSNSLTINPNRYEPGRATIVAHTYNGATTVTIDPSTVLTNGAHYEIINAYNPTAAPITTGTWTGGTITLPTALNTASPIGMTVDTNPTPTTSIYVIRTTN
jgi:hypothetical protein